MSRSTAVPAASIRTTRLVLLGLFVLLSSLVLVPASHAAISADTPDASLSCTTGLVAPLTLADSAFQGADGDQCNKTGPLLPAGNYDWQKLVKDGGFSTGGLGTKLVDVDSDPNSVYKNGSHEEDPNGWLFENPGDVGTKTNLLATWGFPDQQPNDLFLYLAFAASDAPGTVKYGFELNQNPASETFVNDAGATVIKRRAGDVLLIFNWTGSGSAQIDRCLWEPEPGPNPAPIYKKGVWGSCVDLDLLSEGQGRGNTQTISNFLPGAADTLAPNQFGELAVNLTDALDIGGPGQPKCTSFGAFWMKTLPGNSDNSSLKDLIPPTSVSISNCGRVRIAKETTPTTDATSFDFDGAGFKAEADGTQANSPGDFDLSHGQSEMIEKVEPSSTLPAGTNYTVTENPGAGYELDDIVCTETGATNATPTASVKDVANNRVTLKVDPGELVDCVFKNARETGKLEVKKALSPTNDPGLFDLEIDGTIEKSNATHGGTTGEKTLFTGTHTVGESAGTVGDLADYQKSIECKDGNGTGQVVASAAPDDDGPLNVNVTDDSDIVCTVTNVRETGKLEVKKALSPTNDPGLFDLEIDGTIEKSDATHGGTTGEKTLNTGTHTVGESAGTVGALSDYQKSIECRSGNGTGGVVASTAADDDGPLNVNVTTGSDIVCVVTNVRETGKLEVKKALSPTNDPGLFDLEIDGSIEKSDATHGGTTTEKIVNTGTHTVGESAGTVGALADYQKSIECKSGNGSGGVVASVGPDDDGPLNVNVTDGSDIVCVVTNVRETGKLEVKKALSPTNDPGRFNLRIDGVTEKTDAAHGGATGEKTLNTGTHTVGESAGSVGDLADYQKSIECRSGNGTGGVVASAAADDDGPLNVNVTDGSDIVCVVTNVRETGKLEVKKALAPTNDPGLFDLEIDGNIEKSDATHGGTTGEKTLNTGTHTVGESAGTVGALSDYQKSIECKSGNGSGGVVATVGPDDDGPLNVNVTEGSDIVCVVTNVRETGKLEVKKALSPTNDPGLFDLEIDGSIQKSDAAHGGTTGEKTLNTGTHTVGESAGTVGDLANYQKSIECKTENGTGTVVASVDADDDGPLNVNVTDGSDIVCVVTNVRETGKLEVKKALAPTNDPGLFDLEIDGSIQKSDAAHGGTTGEKTLNTGTHTVGESAGTVGALSDYQKSIECRSSNGTGGVVASVGPDDDGPLNVNVTDGSDIVCVITNSRETGKLEVKKALSPTNDPGLFDLEIDGSVEKSDATHGGTTGEKTLNTGTHTVGESAGTVGALSDYQKSIECKADNGAGSVVASVGADDDGPLNVNVTTGSDIVCTVTNVRETGKLEVKKALSPTNDPGLFDLEIDGNIEKSDATHGGTTGEKTLNTGTHTVGESAGTVGDLSDYQKSIECKADNGTGSVVASVGADDDGPLNVNVTDGSDIVCVVTNVRETGKLEVIKDIKGNADGDTFNLEIDGVVKKANAADGDSTTELTYDTGTYTVSEAAGSDPAGINLADYQKSIVCVDGTTEVAATTPGQDDASLDVEVKHGTDVVCTITNERERGKLEVIKNIVGNAGGDTFNLEVEGVVRKENAGDGDSTTELTYDTGTYTVSEAPGTDPTGTNLADYQKSIVCVEDGEVEVARLSAGDVVAKTTPGEDDASLDVEVAHGADVVCTITNEREQGKLEVVKDVVGDAGDDTFNLRVAGVTKKENAGDGDSTGELTYDTGAYTVSETAGTAPADTNLDWYTKKVVCVDGGQTVAQTTPGQDLASLQVEVEHDADVVCTITNDLEEGTVRVEKQTDPDETNGETFGFTTTAGSAFSLADDQVESRTVRPGTYSVTEGTKAGYRLQGIACDDGNSTGSTGSRTATYDIGPGENVKCTFTNTKLNASTVVVKAGNEFAYHGDQVTYTFTVTNPGNSPLTDVVVTDDKCAPVTGPDKQVNGGDANALDPGDRWVYSCTTTIGAHVDGEENPRINTVTVTAKDEQGRPVGSKDDHATKILHPAIAIDKTGPGSGVAGQPVDFAMAVTNPGDVSFTEGFVATSDQLCEAPPALGSKNGDQSPITLDPGDRWNYTCRVQTTAGQTEVRNTAKVTGTDPNGRKVSAEDTVVTPLSQPVRQVAASRRAPGAARLQGPSGCVNRPFTVRIRGREIQRVAFFIGNKRVRTLRAKASQNGREQVLTFKIDPRNLRRGKIHRVSARVTFTTESGTQARTLRLAFQRCRAAVKPKFTG